MGGTSNVKKHNALGSFEAIAIQPVSGDTTDISNRVNCIRRDKEFLAGLRTVDFSADLKFHGPIDDHYDFIGAVNEILPAPARRVDPYTAAETALRPVGFHSFLIHESSK